MPRYEFHKIAYDPFVRETRAFFRPAERGLCKWLGGGIPLNRSHLQQLQDREFIDEQGNVDEYETERVLEVVPLFPSAEIEKAIKAFDAHALRRARWAKLLSFGQ